MSDCRFGVSPVNYPDPDPELPNTSKTIASDVTSDNFPSSILHKLVNNENQVNIRSL